MAGARGESFWFLVYGLWFLQINVYYRKCAVSIAH